MPLPLALFASSYNEDDESGTTLNQNSKASYIPSKNNKNNYMLDGDGNGNGSNSNNNNNNDKPKNKNPSNMRKTIKQKPSAPNESKLSALLKSMDESSDSENENDDSHGNLVNYKGVSENNNNNNNNSSSIFPPLPELNYKGPSMMQSLSSSSSSSSSSSPSSHAPPASHTPDIPTSSTGAVSNSSYDNIPSTYANQYYKQFVPYMNQSSSEMPEQPKSELIEKLNYIIDILEEQQDYKTNSIFEDLILYAFLGIFVIFIVDSFSRSGKYVR